MERLRMRALRLVGDRNLELADIPAPAAPGGGEVQIRTRATALNHIDVWGWRGMAFAKRKLPVVVGAEAVGEIAAGVAVTDAACAPLTFATVEHMLFDNACLEPGETVEHNRHARMSGPVRLLRDGERSLVKGACAREIARIEAPDGTTVETISDPPSRPAAAAPGAAGASAGGSTNEGNPMTAGLAGANGDVGMGGAANTVPGDAGVAGAGGSDDPGTVTRGNGPCDIYAGGNTPCVAAYSLVRALSNPYDGPL